MNDDHMQMCCVARKHTPKQCAGCSMCKRCNSFSRNDIRIGICPGSMRGLQDIRFSKCSAPFTPSDSNGFWTKPEVLIGPAALVAAPQATSCLLLSPFLTFLMRRAGLPPTIVQGSTSFVTTAPAPIVDPLPTFTPPAVPQRQAHISVYGTHAILLLACTLRRTPVMQNCSHPG